MTLSRPVPSFRPRAAVRRARPAAPLAVLVGAAALAGCGGDDGSRAYAERYERACDALVDIGATYQRDVAAVATASQSLDERETVRRVRVPVTAMLDRTLRTYEPLREARAPREWRAFQDGFRERLDRVVPALTDVRRRIALARSQDDVRRATTAVTRLAATPELRVPESLVDRAPACRVLTGATRG